MAKRETLTVTVSPEGELTIDADGHHGPTCLAAIAEISNALGPATTTTKKPEFHQTIARTTTVKGSR